MSLKALIEVINILNKSLDIFFVVVVLVGLIYSNYRTLILSASEEMTEEAKRIAQDEKNRAKAGGASFKPTPRTVQDQNIRMTGIGRAIYLWIILVAFQVIFLIVFVVTPETAWFSAETLRWFEIYAGLSLGIYLYTRENGGRRGLYSLWSQLTVVLVGWNIGRWFGIFFVSLPLLAIFYYLVYRYAEVIIPPSDPEDPKERWDRFKILAWYLWGMQYSIFVMTELTGNKMEARIKGDIFQDVTGAPGYIWAHAYQAVGITGGTSFSRVEGPGAIYTRQYERPLDKVVDLRTQLRTGEVEAITQDGIPIKAWVFMAFTVDREPWDRSLYNRLKFANPMMEHGMLPDHGSDHFQYSRVRVRNVIGMEGVRTNTSGPVCSPCLPWDEQVVHMVEEAARREISEIPLSELWLPNAQQDAKGVSALDLLAGKIKDENNPNGLYSILQASGVRLYTARVVNYSSQDDESQTGLDGITRHQIPTWRARWEKQIQHKLVEADTEAEQRELDANSLARSRLLSAIAQSLQDISANNKDLPRYLIAMRFLGALDEMIRQEPEFATEDKSKALRERFAFLEGKSLPPGS